MLLEGLDQALSGIQLPPIMISTDKSTHKKHKSSHGDAPKHKKESRSKPKKKDKSPGRSRISSSGSETQPQLTPNLETVPENPFVDAQKKNVGPSPSLAPGSIQLPTIGNISPPRGETPPPPPDEVPPPPPDGV